MASVVIGAFVGAAGIVLGWPLAAMASVLGGPDVVAGAEVVRGSPFALSNSVVVDDTIADAGRPPIVTGSLKWEPELARLLVLAIVPAPSANRPSKARSLSEISFRNSTASLGRPVVKWAPS
jgi:hypothetical protein